MSDGIVVVVLKMKTGKVVTTFGRLNADNTSTTILWIWLQYIHHLNGGDHNSVPQCYSTCFFFAVSIPRLCLSSWHKKYQQLSNPDVLQVKSLRYVLDSTHAGTIDSLSLHMKLLYCDPNKARVARLQSSLCLSNHSHSRMQAGTGVRQLCCCLSCGLSAGSWILKRDCWS